MLCPPDFTSGCERSEQVREPLAREVLPFPTKVIFRDRTRKRLEFPVFIEDYFFVLYCGRSYHLVVNLPKDLYSSSVF
jgi:hypothetical protein